MTNLFYSLISLIIALFFIMIGVIAAIIPWSEYIGNALIHFILKDALAISLFGFTSIVVGLAIAINILQGTKRRYYHIKTTPSSAFVDENVIHQYLSNYWQQLFPGSDIPFHVLIKHNKINITADLPPYPLGDQRALLERIKKDLQDTFVKILDYRDEFNLAVSFQKHPTPA